MYNTIAELAAFLDVNKDKVRWTSKLLIAQNKVELLDYIINTYQVEFVGLFEFGIEFGCKYNNVEMVRYLLSKIPDEYELNTSFFETNMMRSLGNRYKPEVATLILKLKINAEYVPESTREEMFSEVCKSQNIPGFTFLKENNLLPKNLGIGIKWAITLHYAYHYKNGREFVITLIKETNVNIHYDDEYFFKFACLKKDFDLMNALFEKESEQGPIYLDPDTFINACNIDSLSFVQFLVSLETGRNKINIHYERRTERNGYSSAFMLALRRDSYKIAEYIISLASTHGLVKVKSDILNEYWLDNNKKYWLIHAFGGLDVSNLKQHTVESFAKKHIDTEYNSNMTDKSWKSSMCKLINFQQNLQ